MQIDCEHDPRADAVYLRVGNTEWVRQHSLDDERVLDFDAHGALIGIELLCVSHGVDTAGIPHQTEVERVLADHGILVRMPHSAVST